MGIFYTGKGDSGISEVWDGRRLDKTSPGLIALGDLDETNSILGVLRSRTGNKNNKKILISIQEDLFIVQANIYFSLIGQERKSPALGEEKVRMIERIIDTFEIYVGPERGFIISGENPEEAWLDYARTVSRRAERSVLVLNKEHKINPVILSYLNRLSSLLFAMARGAAKKSGKKEHQPKYK